MLFVLYIYINIYNAYGAYLVEYLYNFFLYQLELLLEYLLCIKNYHLLSYY